MSLATDSPLSSLPDAIMPVSRESEQNLPVSLLNCLPSAFADNCQIQDSGSALFPNAQNIIINDSTIVVVSLSCVLYKRLATTTIIIVHISSVRPMSVIYPPILGKGI